MSFRVVYDSTYGNTAAIAESIGAALESDRRLLPVGEARRADPVEADLLVLESPTQAGRHADAIRRLIEGGTVAQSQS